MSTSNQKLLKQEEEKETIVLEKILDRKKLFLSQFIAEKISDNLFIDFKYFNYSHGNTQEITFTFQKKNSTAEDKELFKLELKFDYSNNSITHKFESPWNNKDFSLEALSAIGEASSLSLSFLKNINVTKFSNDFLVLVGDIEILEKELSEIIGNKKQYLEHEYNLKEQDIRKIFEPVTREESTDLIDKTIYSHQIEKSQRIMVFKRKFDTIHIETKTIHMANKRRLSLSYEHGRISKDDLYIKAHKDMTKHKGKIITSFDDFRNLGIEIKDDAWSHEMPLEDFYNHFKGVINAINF